MKLFEQEKVRPSADMMLSTFPRQSQFLQIWALAWI